MASTPGRRSRGHVPDLELAADPQTPEPPLQIIVDGEMVGSPIPRTFAASEAANVIGVTPGDFAREPSPICGGGSSRSVSPCPSITVDPCDADGCDTTTPEEQQTSSHHEDDDQQAQAQQDPEQEERCSLSHMLSLPRRRHSDVSTSGLGQSLTYYKTNLLAASRSDNVLYRLQKSLDLSGASDGDIKNPHVLSLPADGKLRAADGAEGSVLMALCSPQSKRKNKRQQRTT